jgi:hypothetical protein
MLVKKVLFIAARSGFGRADFAVAPRGVRRVAAAAE